MGPVTTLQPIAEQRAVVDRRRRPTPALSRWWLRGGRRAGERLDVYVDRYTAVEWACLLGLVALTLADCGWTWAHLARGVEEVNPVLAWAWRRFGLFGFAALKVGVTLGGVFVLLLHARFRWTRRLLPVALGLYALVLGVHALTEFALAAG